MRESELRGRASTWMVSLAAVALFAGGCSVSTRHVVKPGEAPGPALTASHYDLQLRYEQETLAVNSINATVSMKLTAGSAYSGVIEQYHEVNGFILASRPANIRVIGQAPVVGKNIFDMVSDGKTFRIFIPSKNKFIEGRADLRRPANKPVENLRPQHLFEALIWDILSGGKADGVLFEEAEEGNSRYYILTGIKQGFVGTRNALIPYGFYISRKIWFDRSDLRVARIQLYTPLGNVDSDIRYADWQPAGDISYPREITIKRPGDDYKLEITIKKLTLNESISADRFVLEQPKGSELVRVGEEAKEQP
jgi:outer membrane lipoprotein-sorting protein